MNAAQAAYNLLLMLSAVDGQIDESERDVIRQYVKSRFDKEVEFSAEESELETATPEELMQRFQQSAKAYLLETDLPQREALLFTGFELVMTDGKLTEEERALFRSLAMAWGVKYEATVAKYTQQKQASQRTL